MGGGLLLVVALAIVWINNSRATPDESLAEAIEAGAVAEEVDGADPGVDLAGLAPLTVGRVTNCQQLPAFADALDFQQVSIDTTGESAVGMILFDPTRGVPNRGTLDELAHQDESWDDAGHVGSHVLDTNGNIFVVTWPRIDLGNSPLAAQNVLYRVDATSGMMEFYMEMPAVRPPDLTNPFGTAGVAYDCDTHSLYVTTLTGSTRTEQAGRIFRIDLETDQIVDQLNGMDAFGVIVFNGTSGKRLYYGLARAPEVWSLPLDGEGNFAGEPRLEFDFSDYGSDIADSARRLTINADGVLTVDTLKFKFTLEQPAEQTRISYAMVYDEEADEWRLQEVLYK